LRRSISCPSEHTRSAGVLLAFGVAPALALPAVLACRTVAVWLPTPFAIAAVPALRATVGRWRREAGSARPLRSAAEMSPRELAVAVVADHALAG
jgi:hypothetical protein